MLPDVGFGFGKLPLAIHAIWRVSRERGALPPDESATRVGAAPRSAAAGASAQMECIEQARLAVEGLCDARLQ